jgi:hypothetical protein
MARETQPTRRIEFDLGKASGKTTYAEQKGAYGNAE